MQTAVINGKPSLYLTPVTPVPVINPDPSTYFADVVRAAKAMAEDAMTNEDWLNDPEVQAELNAWYAAQDTPEAREEYDAWVTEQERIAIESECEMTPEQEEHLCSQFDDETAELASLGDGARYYIAGHDAVWQEGGEI